MWTGGRGYPAYLPGVCTRIAGHAETGAYEPVPSDSKHLARSVLWHPSEFEGGARRGVRSVPKDRRVSDGVGVDQISVHCGGDGRAMRWMSFHMIK